MTPEPNAKDLLARITHDPRVMGWRPCIRGMRITVGTLVGLLAAGHSAEQILDAYQFLDRRTSRPRSPTPRGAVEKSTCR
jgi:uncharacterized protein (DUF433 family)